MKYTKFLLTGTIAWLCINAFANIPDNDPPAKYIDAKNMDTSVKPGDDFYR